MKKIASRFGLLLCAAALIGSLPGIRLTSSVDAESMESMETTDPETQTLPEATEPCSPVWSMYNPNTSEHLFTTSDSERYALSKLGWKDEGICFGTSLAQSVPVYRYYSKAAGEHLYTVSRAEGAALEQGGWKAEGTAFYASSSAGKQVYRLLNPNSKKGSHHYTDDEAEIAALTGLGWKVEGRAFSVSSPYLFAPDGANGSSAVRAFDSNGQPVSGIIRLRTGTYYFDPEQDGVMATGWRTISLSALDLAPETARTALESAGYQIPEKTSGRQISSSSRSDELARNPESARISSRNGTMEDLQQQIARAQKQIREDLEEQKHTETADAAGFISEETAIEQKEASMETLTEIQPAGSADRSETAASSDLIEVYFQSDGTMAKGEKTLEDGIHYFHPQTGQHYRNSWLRYGNPKKTCYLDENGVRASGTKTIQGRSCRFDEQTGALAYDLQSLFDSCVQYIQSHKKPGEDYSFSLRIVDTGQALFWNDHLQQSASVMKLFVMGAVFENYDSYCQRFGKNNIDANLKSMITVSDNDAWVYLVSVVGDGDYALGCSRINDWNNRHGYTKTIKQPIAYGNYTSVHDCSKILEDIDKGVLKNSARMKELIRQQAVPGRLLQGIPAQTVTGNKPGWLYNTENDTVIVWTGHGTYTVSLLSTELQSPDNAQAIMKTVSEMVYRWMEDSLFQVPQV